MALSTGEGALLVRMARKVVDVVAIEERTPELAELSTERAEGSRFLREHRGAFVTLNTIDGQLRGCIGLPYPVKPLGEAVLQAAVGAASSDPRFPRVVSSELDRLTVEVSALTQPEPARVPPTELASHVVVGRDGLIVSYEGSSGLLLPQVATEMGLSAAEFISLACRKAGLPPDAWLHADVSIQRFQAEVFGESEPRGPVCEPRAGG